MKEIVCPRCKQNNYINAQEDNPPAKPLPEQSCRHRRSHDPDRYAKLAVRDGFNRLGYPDVPSDEWMDKNQDWLLGRFREHFQVVDGLVFGTAEDEDALARNVYAERRTSSPAGRRIR